MDDTLLITKNIAIQGINIRTLHYIFTSYDPELYVPLTLFTYQLTFLFFKFNPALYHLGNLLLHFGSSVAVYLILERLTERKWIAFFAALIFALHPLNTEAVMWAAARKDVLAAFFGLFSLLCAIRASDGESRFAWPASAILFALGLLSKVSIITLPFVFLVIEWWRGRLRVSTLRSLTPHFVLCVIFGVIAVIGKTHVIGASNGLETLLLVARSTFFYFEKIFFPFGLSVIYPAERPILLANPTIIISILFIAVLVALAFFCRKRLPSLTAAILIFGLLLLPNETNFAKNGFLFFASDRYAYLAELGIVALLAGMFVHFTDNIRDPVQTYVRYVLALALTLALGGVSFVHAKTWHNSETMYENVLRFYPSSALALNNMGSYLVKAGREDEAEIDFKKALEIDPHQMSANLNMGDLEHERGNLQKAEAYYKTAINKVEEKSSLNMDELGPFYYLAQLYDEEGRRSDAINTFMDAVQKAPTYAEPRYNLAVELEKLGRKDEAIPLFQSAIERTPLYLDARYHLAALLSEKGQLTDAITQLEEIVKVVPDYEEAAKHLAAMKAMVDAPN